jgi:hypothetical protein
MFGKVYKLHGLPKSIVSDRDVLFTSTFWQHLNKLIGTQLRMSSAYHPQTDGATERTNRTVTQMLRQCIDAKQTDWVTKLPAIEFAINSARSASTGYAPFFLNTGRMPRSMILDSAKQSEYPGVQNFAMQQKMALMAAHDSILGARVNQIRSANKKRQVVPFKKGDLVYLSSKNIKFPKGLARKLIPKFMGPYRILEDYGNRSFQVELPTHLKQRGVHNVFHVSLLRIHVPNDDRLFPGRLDTQLGNADGTEGEWAMDRIIGHAGSKIDATFEIRWKTGDVTWMPYYQVSHLNALQQYFELLGIANISHLAEGKGKPPSDDPQTFIGNLEPGLRPANKSKKTRRRSGKPQQSLPSSIRAWLDQLIHEFSSFPKSRQSPGTPSSIINSPCHPCEARPHVRGLCSSSSGVSYLVSPREQRRDRDFTSDSWRATGCLPGIRHNAPHGRKEAHSSHRICSVRPDIQFGTWSASQFRLHRGKRDLDGIGCKTRSRGVQSISTRPLQYTPGCASRKSSPLAKSSWNHDADAMAKRRECLPWSSRRAHFIRGQSWGRKDTWKKTAIRRSRVSSSLRDVCGCVEFGGH